MKSPSTFLLRKVVYYVCSVVFLAALAFRCFSQAELIRVETDLITIPVSVFQRNGRYLAGLKKDEFHIFENGVEQEIELFENTLSSFTALLLLDNSGSMNQYLTGIAQAANTFVGQLRSEDYFAVAVFADGSKIEVIQNPTTKKNISEQLRLRPRAGDDFTTTFDAVDRGMKYVAGLKGRRAIVLFTDGELFGYKASAKGNLRDADELDAVIYTVRFGDFPTHQPGYPQILSKKDSIKLQWRSDVYLTSLADRTGGRSYRVTEISDLKETFRQIAEDMGQQYLLGYYPKSPGKSGERRKISVKVDALNVAVRSRNEVVFKKTK